MAHAQSSVTLYGIVDTGITYVSNQQVASSSGAVTGKSSWSMVTGNNSPSTLGFRGTEDLGGGLSAIFDLRNYFLSNNGTFFQANNLFDGSAFVGLKSERFGTLTLGRQFDSYTNFMAPYAASNMWAGFTGAHFGDADNLNAAFSVNNTVQYLSPTFAGFSFGATFGLGNTTNFATDRAWSVGAGYAAGPASIAVGYLSIRNPFTAALGGPDNYIGEFSCGQTPSSYCQIQNADELRTFGIAGGYTFDKLSINANLTHAKYLASQYLVQAGGSLTDATFDTAELNGLYSLAPDLQFGASYAYTRAKLNAVDRTARVHKVNLAALYSLSKRTLVYLIGSYEKMASDGIGIDPLTGGFKSYAQLPYFGNANSSSQTSVSVGIKHTF
jgi:predicted porin